MPLQVRRGTTAERGTITPLVGELVYDTQEGKLYVGDGVTAGGVPASAYSDDDAQDAVFAALNHSDHTGIRFTYNDTAAKITAIVNPDLTEYEGTISADGFKGSIFADDSTLIFNSVTGTVSANFRGDLVGSVFSDNSTILIDGVLAAFNLDGTVRTDIIPAVNEVYDLGSSGARFKDIYLSGTSIFLGNATITATGSAVNLPAGSTVGGIAIGSGSGTGDGVIAGSNYNINIVGDNSSLMVDVSTNTFTGNFVGNYSGNYTGVYEGNLFGSVVGDLKGSVYADDSGIIIDGTERLVVADLIGNVVGNRNSVSDQILINTSSSTVNVDNVIANGMAATTFFGDLQGDVTGVITGLTGSTIIGDLIGNTDGFHNGNVKGSIFATTSDVLVEHDTGRHFGTFIGNVVGNVLGNVSGDLFGTVVGNVTGNVTGDLTGTADEATVLRTALLLLENQTVSGLDPTATSLNLEELSIVITEETNFGGAIFPRVSFESFKTSGGSRIALADTDLIAVVDARPYNGSDFASGGALAFFVNDASISPGDSHFGTKVLLGDASHVVAQDGQHITVDANGVTSSAAFVTGSYATGAEPSSPVAGMIIFDSTTQKYKGYVTDTGLAGGGAANSTPGWVDFY
jgi:outer membrane lipoprotein SlyB